MIVYSRVVVVGRLLALRDAVNKDTMINIYGQTDYTCVCLFRLEWAGMSWNELYSGGS